MIVQKYLIISMENQCVFTMEHGIVNAHDIALGNFNCFVRPIDQFNIKNFSAITTREFFKENYYKLESLGRELIQVDPNNVSEEWKSQQALIWLRQEGHRAVGLHHSRAIASATRYHWPQFSTEALLEIDKCDPDTNSYTRLIEEYARALDQPVKHVYKELKLKLESEQVVKFRITGLTQKWKSVINNITTQEELDDARKRMINEFWINHIL